jgi:hypothetical protein
LFLNKFIASVSIDCSKSNSKEPLFDRNIKLVLVEKPEVV